MYLAPHINTLFSMIRNRGLVQYFSPYSSADLNKMANSFNTTVSDLENELMKLILDGSIQARIDSHNKVLLAQDVDQRSQIFTKAVEMCELYQRRAKMLLLRSAIVKANINVKVGLEESQRTFQQISYSSCFSVWPGISRLSGTTTDLIRARTSR